MLFRSSDHNSSLITEITPIILVFSAPSEIVFTINPNTDPAFIAAEYSIVNSTKAPLSVAVKEIAIRSGQDFNLVAPNHFADWNILNVTQSKNLALGVKTINDGWASRNTNVNWSTGINPAGEDLGVVLTGQSAKFSFEAKHGYAFETAENVVCDMVLVFKVQP